MIFPVDFESRIGFNRIREILSGYCLSDLGRRRLDSLVFSNATVEITETLKANREFLSILQSGESYPDKHYIDPSAWLGLASMENACLQAEEIWSIRQSLSTVRDWLKFFSTHADFYPLLSGYAKNVLVSDLFIRQVDQAIDENSRIRDRATPELYRIRTSIESAIAAARKRTEVLFREALAGGICPEGASPVFREGRVVIPVRAGVKRKFRGVIVDESSTGQTVFMEPEQVMEANNEIRDLQHEEKREEYRILRGLTDLIRLELPSLEPAYQFLAEMDVNRAKAKLSSDLNADLPVLKNAPGMTWKQARHPLLYLMFKGKRNLVPLDIRLESASRILLVSGPNAGGKSVCLKTVGLVQYMLQCGLLPPAHPDSEFGVFDSLFLDIGDQQSIENDLSTYSSHLKNMAGFLEAAGNRSLVLMDELGSGTDPAFGGGIAEAVLSEIVKQGAWGLVTTHYANLKTLPERISGIENAAMLFDSAQLKPLFILQIGKPGSSYAMELARKSGLPSRVIQDAERLIGTGLIGLEELMQKTESDKVTVQRLKTDLEKREKLLNDQVAKYERLTAELQSGKKEIIDQAKREAENLLSGTRREIEKTIRHIKENRAEKKETKKAREKLSELSSKVSAPKELLVPEAGVVIKEGDSVRLRGHDYSGTVLNVKGNEATVQFGLMRSTVLVNQLHLVSGTKEKKQLVVSNIDLASRRSTFRTEIDLRGKRVEEVVGELASFMDDAVMFGVAQVRILHGKGEGVLRKVVRDQLSKNKSVASISDEHADRGGAGITIVVLK